MAAMRVLLHALLAAMLWWTSGARAAEPDDFQVLLQHAALPESVRLAPGQPLTSDTARVLWNGLLESPASLSTFGPRTVLASLARESLATGQPLPYTELLSRTERFRRLMVVRPDGYGASALSGKPLARLGSLALQHGELYVQGLRVGAFHFNEGGVFYAVDGALQRTGPPVGELPLGRDPATAALLGAEDAFTEMARGLAAFVTQPVRTLRGLSQLPSAVAGLIANSPEYLAHYEALNLEDQVHEAARLATHVLTLQAGAASAGPRLASASRLPVLTLSAQGTLAVRELALPAGAMTAVVGAGAASASIVLMAQADGTAGGTPPWPPAPGGPGEWTKKAERMSGAAQRYQSQVTGAPEGWVYRVRTGPGPKDFVDFDGFKDGVLLEIKGPGYRKLLQKMHGKEWFDGVDDMIAQANRQLNAAGSTPIRWHFAEQEVAGFIRKLFQDKGLDGIEVVSP